MILKAFVEGDIVLSIGSGPVPGIVLPDALMGVPPDRLRFTGSSFVDIASLDRFYIDEGGNKHVIQSSPPMQEVVCPWDATLLKVNGQWVVAIPVPRSVSPLQMRKALRAQGLKAAIDAYLAEQDEETAEAWEYATEIDRSNAMITAAATALGKSEAEIDDLFRLAVTL